MAKMTMVQAVRDAMRVAMEQDERVVVFGEDVGPNGGVFRATDGLHKEYGEKRIFDTPLAESAIIGHAVGMAALGMKPIAEIQFMGFIYEAMDQIASQAGRLRSRSGGRFNIPMVLRTPFGGGVKTPELHSDSLETIFMHSPGWKIAIPSNPYDAKGMLLAAIEDPDPVLFMESMPLYRSVKQEVPEEAYTVPLGQANIVKEGQDATILTYGNMVRVSQRAVEQMEKERDASIEIVDLRTLIPLDMETIASSVEKTGRVVVVTEHVRTAGAASEIITRINERSILHVKAPIQRVTGLDTPYPISALEDDWLPSPKRIQEALADVLDFD